MEKKQDGGPAFPASTRPMQDEYGYGHQDGLSTWQYGGMTLRDYFAANAMQGMLANQHQYRANDEHMFARDAYVVADAMLRAREAV